MTKKEALNLFRSARSKDMEEDIGKGKAYKNLRSELCNIANNSQDSISLYNALAEVYLLDRLNAFKRKHKRLGIKKIVYAISALILMYIGVCYVTTLDLADYAKLLILIPYSFVCLGVGISIENRKREEILVNYRNYHSLLNVMEDVKEEDRRNVLVDSKYATEQYGNKKLLWAYTVAYAAKKERRLKYSPQEWINDKRCNVNTLLEEYIFERKHL